MNINAVSAVSCGVDEGLIQHVQGAWNATKQNNMIIHSVLDYIVNWITWTQHSQRKKASDNTNPSDLTLYVNILWT